MSVIRRRRLRTRLRDERGFTLIETLVAMVTGIAVMGGLFAVLEVSLHQSTRIADVVQATQLGRQAMTHIVDELHSSCIAQNFTPIQAESSATKLIFVTGYSEKAELAEAHKDEIVFNPEAQTLTDNVFNSSGGAYPEFTFSKAPNTSVLIAKNITQSTEGTETLKKVPVFSYYEYAVTPPNNETRSAASSTLVERPLPKTGSFTAEEAKKIASVQVSFRAGPTSGSGDVTRKADLSSQATFAFSAPSSEATIEAAPCE